MIEGHPNQEEIQCLAKLNSAWLNGWSQMPPALARLVLALQKDRDEAQTRADKHAETLNDIADILGLPTGAEDRDILEAVRKMVPPTAEGES